MSPISQSQVPQESQDSGTVIPETENQSERQQNIPGLTPESQQSSVELLSQKRQNPYAEEPEFDNYQDHFDEGAVTGGDGLGTDHEFERFDAGFADNIHDRPFHDRLAYWSKETLIT